MHSSITWALVEIDTVYFWHKEWNTVGAEGSSLNKALYVSALFSLEKVLMEDSFQYLPKNVYFYYLRNICLLEKNFKFKKMHNHFFTWIHTYKLLLKNESNSHLYLFLPVWFWSWCQNAWISHIYYCHKFPLHIVRIHWVFFLYF